MTLALRYAARSDRGLIRGNNEDSVYAGPRLLAVADGMGGHAAGEVASKIVIAALEHLDEDALGSDLLEALRHATQDGTAHLRELVNDDPALEGMGTTLTALLFAGTRLAVCHVGDSRCYLLRDQELVQITHDDSFVQTLVDEGRITEAEAHVHPQRSLILRALNGSEIDPDLSVRETRVGDRYLLCTDGLSDVVSTETMQEALLAPDPQAAADRLVELALRGGGPDNITCIVADVVDEGTGERPSVAPVVDGAAGDNVGQRDVSASTSAGRAALVGPRPDRAPEVLDRTPPPSRRRRGRALLMLLAIVIVAAGGLFAAWRFTQNQYYVGVDGDQVAVFRGVDVQVTGMSLSSRLEISDIALTDLNAAARGQVVEGIPADDPADAERILSNLRRQLLRPCPTATPPAASSTSPSAATTSAPSTSAASTSAATGATLEPGVDCRTAGGK